MTPEILSAIRHVLTALGGAAVTGGYITEDGLQAIIGAVLILAPLVWGVIEKRTRKDPQ